MIWNVAQNALCVKHLALFFSARYTPRMNEIDLAAMREGLGLSQEAFGTHLARLMGLERDYSRQEVNAWEKGRRALPGAIAAMLWRERALEAEKALALAMSRLERLEKGRG